jgi:subtilisin-like proprotein convertase family protein
MKKYCLFFALLFGSIAVNAQGLEEHALDANTHGSVFNMAVAGTRIYCTGVDSAHSVGRGYDYWVTVIGNCASPNTMAFVIDDIDLRFNAVGNPCADTVFIYDGIDTSAPLIWYATGNTKMPSVNEVFAGPENTSQALTLRFKVCNDCGPWDYKTGRGFSILADCRKPCEQFKPVLDSIFYKTHNGVVYDVGKIKHLYDYSNSIIWDSVLNDSIEVIDSMPFDGVNLCIGDGVIFTAHCEYNYSTGWYYPSDSTSYFMWTTGNGDTIAGVGVTSIYYDEYYKVSCNELILSVTDSAGCGSTYYPQVRVRLAQNPLKTVFTLRDICNRDSLLVNMGYGGSDATLVLDSITYEDGTSKTNFIRTFIPDGPRCTSGGQSSESLCYRASVVFTDFPNGRTVQTKGDICSVCINMEHTYMGDYDLALYCPTGNKAVLKYYSTPSPTPVPAPPAGTSGGGGRYTGVPYGGTGFQDYDHMRGDDCDSTQNPYGIGWNYCFSRNGDYTLVNGEPANTDNPTNAGMANAPTMINYSMEMPNIPPGFDGAGSSCGTVSISTLDSSNHAEKTNYYIPASDFSQLVGCPLNGEWSVEICDHLGRDNGWVFSFSVDICNVNTDGCKYQVAIDSLVWNPDTSSQYHDYELGYYRGLVVHRHNDIESYVLTPDTAGTFPINVKIYDEFGCVWDTSTSITSYWTPKPDLGNDTTLCGVITMPLDASDYHAEEQGYTYIWEPFGQDSSGIVTKYEPGSDIRYIVQVTNTQMNTVCVTRDTIDVKLRSQPFPSFVPIPFALEGCSPYTLTFDNQTANADKHLWLFGDGQYSEQASPTHTYTEGVYDLKYYVTSIDGCKDSLIFDDLIAIYPSPKASFVWEPNYPSVLQPTVLLTNTTENVTENTHFFWEMQYDRNNLLSVQTLTNDSPLHDFSSYVEPSELAGSYTVRLIARSDNMAPSGNIIYCRDTTENTILLVNDFLQFPSVVTPNGDGINDKFIIGNLVGGMAYPVNTLDVYNKWGTRVFHKENVATNDDFWDPIDVPAGTYFYRFSARGYNGNIEHNGAVEIIK